MTTAADRLPTFELPPALTGRRVQLDSPLAGRISWYQDGPAGPARREPPLLLIHSINAAPSAYEVKPLYDHYKRKRPVYALELPGFGFSERTQREYTPRIMTDAIHALVAQIRLEQGGAPLDALALSLSAEFLARAAEEVPASFRSIGLVSPTGFDRKQLLEGPTGSTLGRPWLRATLRGLGLRRPTFAWLTSRPVIKRFLEGTWGSKQFDSRLLHYAWLTSHVPGAEYAPIDFITGYLFSRDSGRVYRQVPIPVWVAHGIRGDFRDFRGLQHMMDRRNWQIEVFSTGALPHFERPGEFIQRYEDWCARPQTATRRERRVSEAMTPAPAGRYGVSGVPSRLAGSSR